MCPQMCSVCWVGVSFTWAHNPRNSTPLITIKSHSKPLKTHEHLIQTHQNHPEIPLKPMNITIFPSFSHGFSPTPGPLFSRRCTQTHRVAGVLPSRGHEEVRRDLAELLLALHHFLGVSTRRHRE